MCFMRFILSGCSIQKNEMTISLSFLYMCPFVGQLQISGNKVEMYMLFSKISELRKMPPFLVPLSSDICEP